MTKGHASHFSYNLTRPYPFRWFTPVVIVGGVVLTALFSVLNFAANGYVLGSTFVADPNSTLIKKAWFEKSPFSYSSKLSPSCQPANIAPSTQLTAKSGSQYTLGNVWTEDEKGAVTPLPSLTYLNNSFTDCNFQGIQIFLLNYDPVSNGHYWNWNRDSSATGYVTCSIDNGQLPVHLNLSITVKSALQGNPGRSGYEYLTAKQQTQASLWFGQLLMWMNFNQMLFQMAEVNYTESGLSTLVTGVGMYVVQNPNASSILQDDFMSISEQITGYESYYTVAGGYFRGPMGSDITSIRELYVGGTVIGRAVDGFAKSFYSFILADLGQTSSPSVLADAEVLDQFWTACYNDVDADPSNFVENGSLATNSFDTLKGMTGSIGVLNATLNAQYLCQIPQRKDTASVLFAVIVADLVLLQAAWKIFTWITKFWLEKKDPEAKYCSGCTAQLGSPSVGADSGANRLSNSYEMFKGRLGGFRGSHYAKVPDTQVGSMAGNSTEETLST
ncbi:hypothetical protein LTR10_011606 [Elasticomyces elasticus]|uniref:DUF3533 domain-containing protein n=1 Tax=Exophiala sideris TaxID=1016849 RepID=A0ABR0JCZ4_9EURO|nr:hypothetical protein LTR10_011606 [Elasticomyces elasticus]KAK5031935.1 hypothetical protein LTS07_004556 [Exophiala sideris]KAK5040864.1 hypothetical protein LTR13_003165 [Exophiala sideris]KAK5061801.1 hypothetical protein LTR69_004984 [Exophiala sideris]KAK5184501.1 hypothetical protein LTR44_003175 [Eurotiomycetes sp. CCFEE 6388]